MSDTRRTTDDPEVPAKKTRKPKREAARRRLRVRPDRTAMSGAFALWGFLTPYSDTELADHSTDRLPVAVPTK